MKNIAFRGMGWEAADSSMASDVGNCRVRTELTNKDGRIIFIEFIGMIPCKTSRKDIQQFGVCGMIESCFYTDVEEDNKLNYSKKLTHFRGSTFEYSKANILTILKECFNCNYTEMTVDNS